MTGFVAATGQSYLCPDTTNDPLYLEGAAGARSSLTVPLIYHGTVIGTLNVENAQPNAFDDRDRQFLEIYARNVASALNTLELLQAEKFSAATASVEAISRELALPLDDILERRHHGPRPLRRPRRGHHRPAPAPALPGPRDPQPDPEGRLDDRPRAQTERAAARRPGWPTRGCWWSTPTRRSAGRPTTCSAARGRPSRPPATPTRRSPWRGRPRTRPPWSTSACPTSTASRPTGGSARSSRACRSS